MNDLYPETFARFYDLIYHQQRDSVDHDFFLNEIRQTRGKILEVGVGTGRLFTEALKFGADAYGIDISRPMLDVLHTKLDKDQQHRISQQNILDFHFDDQFDLIIAPFRVFMHLLEKDEQLRALNHVFRYLNPGGKFIFDVFIPDLKQLITGIDHHTDFEAEYKPGNKISRTVSTKSDLLNQRIHITFHMEWEENHERKKEDWKFQLRFFFRYELEHLVERSDFSEYRILGNYLGNELDEKSKDFIVLCEKT
jgi:SAM-dependent methyltransferase